MKERRRSSFQNPRIKNKALSVQSEVLFCVQIAVELSGIGNTLMYLMKKANRKKSSPEQYPGLK